MVPNNYYINNDFKVKHVIPNKKGKNKTKQNKTKQNKKNSYIIISLISISVADY